MKTVILAGGLGTRISEETDLKPKPMVEIGGLPILWHIMKIYSSYGFNDFVICLGYKGYVIKEYFANYFLHMTDLMIDIERNKVEALSNKAEPWKITLIDTGLNTLTGGRIKRIQKYVNNETFFLTYGDGLSDVNINELLSFHKSHGCALTVTAVQPPGRFGIMNVSDNLRVKNFQEKLKGDGTWCNGGFFVCEPKIFDEIHDDETIWERQPLESLAGKNELLAFKHNGFWQPMDTLRDKIYLENLWKSGKAPWKVWNE
ncbi:MAG: glucose-1-phosphate cytidylyltransferase [Candidatus Caenarcaniphilales bacterium]|nr:glucose-1-phosphate cytidylyltransferase [Candidatus Caenarcaniphilales bacterium]